MVFSKQMAHADSTLIGSSSMRCEFQMILLYISTTAIANGFLHIHLFDTCIRHLH